MSALIIIIFFVCFIIIYFSINLLANINIVTCLESEQMRCFDASFGVANI